MFLGIIHPQPALAERLQTWIHHLWPGSTCLTLGQFALICYQPAPGLLPNKFFHRDRLLMIDGTIWRGNSLAAHSNDHLARLAALDATLSSASPWPLSDDWDGSFALLHIDPELQRLAIALDAVGLRRLFYCQHGESLVVGTHQTAIAHIAQCASDPYGLAQWLGTESLLGSRTLFHGVHQLQPGEYLAFDRQAQSVTRILDCPWHSNPQRMSPEAGAALLKPKLYTQINTLLSGSNPVGLALSSGIDSRLVLAAMGEQAKHLVAITYGDPSEYEVRQAKKCARTIPMPHKTANLRGCYFPEEAPLRKRALLSETTLFPFWFAVGDEAQNLNTLLMGDITDCMQVRVNALWHRRVRFLNRLLPWRRDTSSSMPTIGLETWWQSEADRRFKASLYIAKQLAINLDEERLRQAVFEDLEAVRKSVERSPQDHLYHLQERVHLHTARGTVGAQTTMLDGVIQVMPAFATRNLLKTAFEIDIHSRAGRHLLNALVRSCLPPSLARISTTTIPFIPATAPDWIGESVWFARWLADRLIHWSNSRFGGIFPRERLMSTTRLVPEYARAAALFYGKPWGISGQFKTDYYVGRVKRTAVWRKPPVIPTNELRAITADTLLAAALEGPRVLLQQQQPRH